MALTRPLRVLLVGTTGFDRRDELVHIESLGWRDVQRLHNVADHDVVIFNLLPVHDLKSVDWAWWVQHFSYVEMRKVLDSEGMVIVLGDPRFNILQQPFLYWTGMQFAWDTRPGITVQGMATPPFADLARRVRNWNYALADVQLYEWVAQTEPLDFINKRFAERYSARLVAWGVRTDAVCRTRYGAPLLFSVHKAILEKNGELEHLGWHDVRRRGPIVFIPQLDLAEEESIKLILRDVCGVEVALPEPDWLKDIAAPDQAPLDQAIADTRASIVALMAQYETQQADRAVLRDVLRLLYDTGSSHEVAVRRVLSQLGAGVEDPVDESKEDGWLTVQLGDSDPLEFVLEIKSTKNKQFTEDGLRQLHEWKGRGNIDRHKRFKGLFVGTAARLSPPADRTDPFSSSWRRSAAASEVVTLTGDVLLAIYRLHRDGDLDVDGFWRALYDTNGVFDGSQFLPREAS